MQTIASRTALLTALSSSLLLLSSCFTHRKTGQSAGNHLAEAIEIAAEMERYCCDPAGLLPFPIGRIMLLNKNAPGSVTPPVRVGISTGGALKTDVTEIELAAGQSTTVQVDTTGCGHDTDAVTLALGYGDERRVDVVPVRNMCSPTLPLLVAMTLLAPTLIAQEFIRAFVIAPVGRPVSHSGRLIPARMPLWRQTEIIALGIFALLLTSPQLDLLFGARLLDEGAAFPPGAGPNGYTLIAERPMPMPEGGYHVAFLDTDAEIPLSDTVRRYQYAFVFDADGRPENNYRASPDFPNDFFQDTDRWYEVSYEPATGWKLRCKRVDANNRITEVGSAARVVIAKSGMFLVVPQNEFSVAQPRYRMTAFGHEGDFGLRPPHTWSGDVEPAVADGLKAY